MKVIVEVRNVYGNELVYPVCEVAMRLVSLTGRKTFSPNDIQTIRELGYTVTAKARAV